MYTNDIYDLAMTFNMVYIDSSPLKRRITLKTLKVLNNLKVFRAAAPPESPDTAVYTSSNIEVITINPSSQFILSARYLPVPIPPILANIS